MQAVEAEQDRRELASGHGEKKGLRFENAIDMILAFVDSEYFPATFQPISIHCPIVDAQEKIGCGEKDLCEIFTRPEHEEAERLFYRALKNKAPVSLDTEEMVMMMMERAEFLSMAVGFAAGLRAGGLSKETARAMLARYLSAFNNEDA
jgi:hypothetical protein